MYGGLFIDEIEKIVKSEGNLLVQCEEVLMLG